MQEFTFCLRYEGPEAIFFFHKSQLLNVNLIRNTGGRALTGQYMVDILPHDDLFSGPEKFLGAGNQQISLAGNAIREPAYILGHALVPLLDVSVDAFQSADSPFSMHAIASEPQRPTASSLDLPPANLVRSSPVSKFLSVWNRLDAHL